MTAAPLPDGPLLGGADPAAHLALAGALDEPVADGALTEREREVRAIAREVSAHEIVPRARETDRSHRFPHENIQALAGAGLGGLLFPRHLGGTADSNVAYAVVMEEVAAACGSTSLVFMTQMHAAYPILLAGTDDLQHRYVPGLLDASRYGSLAITEPAAGSDVASLTTTARREGDEWVISGQKTFITTGDKADVIICFATVDRERGRDGVTAFVVQGDWPGLERGLPFDKLGMNGSSTAELFLDGVRVPAANVLGGEGGGWKVVMSSVVKSRISAAAQGVGLARAAYGRTLTLLTDLHGPRLPDHLAFELADLRGRILQGRLLLHAVARQVDVDPATSPGQIGMMKQSCTDLGWQVAAAATRLLGPMGDLADADVERCLRDAKVTQIYDGTNEIQRLLIGRETGRAVAALRR